MFNTFKKITAILVIWAMLLVLLPAPISHTANEGIFDPNFLISDEELQAWETMGRADIQAFLESHKSFLATYRTEDVNGAKRLVSDIIYRASREHKINPKYILVKLQKEQSLITNPSPAQKALDWATGYGICDSCSKSDPALQKHKGFGTQVDSAAAVMRWYYDNLHRESWIKRTGKNYTIDSTTVRPASLATGFLYTYTPHIEGNKNFWTLWQRWFEQVYPEGTLVKSDDKPTVYLIEKGQKRPFANMTALVSRFDQKYILSVPQSELTRYEEGPSIRLPNYAIVKTAGKYYLLDNEYARPFANFDVVKKLGFHPDEIIDISSTDLALYKNGKTIGEKTESALGRLVRVKENKNYYFVEDDQFYPISDEQMLETNFPHLSLETISASELHAKTQGKPILFKDGIIFGVEGSNKIYVVEKGKKRHIASETVFNGLGYNWVNIIWTDQFTGLNHATGEPIYLRQDFAPINDSKTIIAGEENKAEEAQSVNEDLASKMYLTPAQKWQFLGPRFETDINTYLIADKDSGEILAGKNIDDARPMASFAKVMTAYRLQKEGLNINGSVTYQPQKHKALYHRYRIAEGERVLIKDLLDAAMVSSLNTPTQMLVYSVEKEQEKFVDRMNSEAVSLGLKNTKFIDVTGERLENITTAREFLKIYKLATSNSDVNKALGKSNYSYNELKDTDGRPMHFDSHSNKLTKKENSLPFRIVNSKTGYLHESGAGLIMEVQRKTDNKRFVIITMGNPDYSNRFEEPERLARWVTDRF